MFSNFKYFKSLLIASILFITFETFIYFKIGRENIIASSIENGLLEKNFKKFDVGQKHIVLYKSQIFKKSNSEFIQVGDSSGLFGVRPNIVKSYLSGMDYINTNCCADMGWEGYAYSANYYLKKNPNAKYLVLYVTPYSLPMQFKKGFSDDLANIFGETDYDNLFNFFSFLPSLYLREDIQNLVYRQDNENKENEFKRVMKQIGVAENFEEITGYKISRFTEFLESSAGWLPYDKKYNYRNIPVDACGKQITNNFYDNSGNGTLKKSLNKIAAVSKKYKVKLIVFFNPVACIDSHKMIPIISEIEEFKKSHPEVLIPFDFITTLNKNQFGDQWHLTTEASIKQSHEIGKSLKKLLKI